MKHLTRLSVTALAVILNAPAFKVRFDLSDLLVYHLPAAIFLGSVLLANVLDVRHLAGRLGHASMFLLMLFGPALALFLGGGREVSMFITILINTCLGMAVVMYPWSLQSMHQLLQALAVSGGVVAIHTLLFFGSNESIREIQIAAGEDYALATSYLATSFTMGVGVLSATYFVVRNFTVASLVVFAVNWLGLAMGRGRGAFLFCALLAILYLIVVLKSQIAGFDRRRKVITISLVVSFVPVIFAQVMRIDRMREGLKQILFNLDVEAERGGRGELFSIALEKIKDAPFLGGGLGEYLNSAWGHPHNLFLQWGVDSGLVGIIALLLFFAVIFRRVARSIKLSNAHSLNMVYCTTALFLFMFLNFMKSGDPYVSRLLPIMAALPVATYLALLKSTGILRAQRLAFGRRTAGRELVPDIQL